jgi:O-antigen/teichoic acid export membrane protein
MVIARKIAYNVVVSSVSKILSTILALVSIGLITRYLGKEGFGNYATVLAFLAFFGAISDLGLYSMSTREISRPKANEPKVIGNIFSLRILASLLILILAPLVAALFPYSAEVKKAIVIIAGSFIFSSTYQVLNGVFQKNLAMDKVAVSEFLGKAIQVLLVYLAVKFQMGFLWIIASILFNMLFSFILVYWLSRKYIKFKLEFDIAYWKSFLKESYPLGIAALIGFVYFKIDTILLSILKSSAEVGIYNAAYKVIENIIFFPAMIIGLIFPIMSKNIFSDRNRFRDISDKTYKVFWILVVPLMVGTLFLSDGIIKLIGGNQFFESGLVLRILVFALVAIFFSNFSNAIMIAGNKQKRLMWITFIAAVFNIVFNLIFIPSYSYIAAAIVAVLTELFVTAATFYIIFKDLNYWPRAEKFGSILMAGALMAGYFLIFRHLNFFLLALSGTLVYFVAIWIFKAVRTEEITSIIGKKEVEIYENLP